MVFLRRLSTCTLSPTRRSSDLEQGIREAGTARDIGGPVARVHVTDRHHISRPRERQRLAEKADAGGDLDALIRLGERWPGAGTPPAFQQLLDRYDGTNRHRAHVGSGRTQRTCSASSCPMICWCPSVLTVIGPRKG